VGGGGVAESERIFLLGKRSYLKVGVKELEPRECKGKGVLEVGVEAIIYIFIFRFRKAVPLKGWRGEKRMVDKAVRQFQYSYDSRALLCLGWGGQAWSEEKRTDPWDHVIQYMWLEV